MRGPQPLDVKVGLGPSLAQKQQQIDSLTADKKNLELVCSKQTLELEEMMKRCTDYVDQIFDLKQKLADSTSYQQSMSAQLLQ